MKKSYILFGIVEAIPLPIFLVYVAAINPSISSDWLGPYIASSIAATISIPVLLLYKVSLNRLFIAINLYFFSGCYGLLANITWLNELYGRMQATGMLAWIILVGLLSMLSRQGFVGVKSDRRRKIRVYSWYLLVVAVLAYMFSLYFKGNKLLSEFLPFIALFTVQGFLRSSLLSTHAK